MRRPHRALISGAVIVVLAAATVATTAWREPSTRPPPAGVATGRLAPIARGASSAAAPARTPSGANASPARRSGTPAPGRAHAPSFASGPDRGRPAGVSPTTTTTGPRPGSVGPPDPSGLWPWLEPSRSTPDRLTARVTGHDPVGDRTIVLWRRDEQGATPITTTHSGPDGRFDFGDQPIPNGRYRLVATAEGGDPLSASPRELTRPAPPAPAFSTLAEDRALWIIFHPALLTGELRITDAHGAVIRRIDAGGRGRSLVLSGAELAQSQFVVHALPDGRQSDRVAIHLAPP